MKKILLLTIASLLFTYNGFAQTSGATGSLTWTLSDEATLLTISGAGAMPDYNPIGGIAPWLSMAPWWEHAETITRIVIDEGVSRIGNSAFAEYRNVVSVNIPPSVTDIGNQAFYLCQSLSSIALPDGLENIGDYAFAGCNLSKITIPQAVTHIGNNALCNSLSAIHVANSNPVYSSEDGVLYDKDKTILIKYPSKKSDTEFSIPSGVNQINKAAFSGCNYLNSVIISEKVNKIEEASFSNCSNLVSVDIPEAVTYIGAIAFSDCSKLVSVNIPSNVTYIGEEAFAKNYALTAVSLPENLTTIERGVFRQCNALTSIVIPNNVVKIGDNAFNSCSGLASITFSENLETIGIKAFAECISLTSIVIPESVTSIGYSAFAHCDGLTSVVISEDVIDMDGSVFADCYNLKNIEVRWNTPLFVPELFENIEVSQSTLHVPVGTKSLYETTAVWKNFGTIIEKSITAITGIENQSVRIRPISGGISIDTKTMVPVSVYTVSGQRIYQTILSGNAEIRLNKGIYIVTVNRESNKIIIN
jgi:hypothetical protein